MKNNIPHTSMARKGNGNRSAQEPKRNPHDIVALWLSVIGGLFVAIVTVMGDYFISKFPLVTPVTYGVTLLILFGLLYFAIRTYQRAADERDGISKANDVPKTANEKRHSSRNSKFWYQFAQVLAVLSGGWIVGAGIFLALGINVLSTGTTLASVELQSIELSTHANFSNDTMTRIASIHDDVQHAQGMMAPIVQNSTQLTS